MDKSGSLLHGILLVAGTSIGGGMLALPVLTSQAGFYPSLVLYLASWFFMCCTGLLFLEVFFWIKGNANILTMAQTTLGRPGKYFAWVLYLFLFYCLTLAYIVGAGDLLISLFKVPLKAWQGQLLFLLLFAPFVYAGTRLVSKLNLYLMLGLGVSYVTFVFLGYSHVNTENLALSDWSKAWAALPITFTAFAYQGIVPTLIQYLHYDVKKARTSILVGSFLPFIAYAIWQWLILGIVPADGTGSLQEAMLLGQNAVQPLHNILNIPGVYHVGQAFAFFALVTSFFGVTLGLLDFLADGLSLEKSRYNRLLLCFLIFIPPFVFALYHPNLFLVALKYAGGIGCALLLGLLPVLMVWSGRYYMGLKSPYKVAGGRFLLLYLIAFVFVELASELLNR